MHVILDTVQRLGAGPRPTLGQLGNALGTGEPEPAELQDFIRQDWRRPYGRNVILETPTLEGMVATWTRATPCAPHDHGGSVGGVRVLQGQAIHRVWAIRDGALRLQTEERVGAGHVLQCGPHLIHSMMDGGAALPLVTLHLYTDPIDYMVVYDVARERTVIVDGGCGAWVPLDQPQLVRGTLDGFHRRADIADRCWERGHAL